MSSVFPKVAVLLAAYNGMAWIEAQLDSLLKQTNVCVSVFISVDTSTDGTEAWCADYAQHHASVTLLPPAGRFGGASRNFFRLIRDVDFSSFDYVAFSDQDDIWHHDKLERAVSTLVSGEHDAYSSNVIAFWPDGQRVLLDKAQPQVRWDHMFEAAGPGCTYVLNRSLADAFKSSLVSHWDAAQAVSLHDWYCYAFARSHDFRWFIDPKPSLDYRQHADNQVGANTGLAPLISRLKKISDGWWAGQVLLINHLTGGSELLFVGDKTRTRSLFLKLAFKAGQCRRRPRDKILFVIACLAVMLNKPERRNNH
ncbi:glycosyltransferase family 2 protein [Pseudomonas cannabina]|uniref:Glycosyltransferase n=3 Tax=Pseudomonas syringae group TaxID=136849 RepID=A0A8T8BXD7_PSEYM|nr:MULTISPECIES: glycosyltransferase family 2 protein [Pseudomonas syringae group]KPB74950.1 Lipopolysaccharide biosynthesis protein [Pseudomonas syringae pv. maculicola]KPW19727.1 Lipopolysaccharide biosynthesis protein [Pseudomonas cannabina pv. alisalensis]MBM0139478.1 glycosyltransferase family 2 protein [Pseudomonas cannabina pv. alisalensis]QHE96030.1 glycosyltransferase [Pseudomonas syringae pv. maculicola str. ES4326]QQN23048.1 glycosyltransferase family 2 protein [Pseudomonas cannabin